MPWILSHWSFEKQVSDSVCSMAGWIIDLTPILVSSQLVGARIRHFCIIFPCSIRCWCSCLSEPSGASCEPRVHCPVLTSIHGMSSVVLLFPCWIHILRSGDAFVNFEWDCFAGRCPSPCKQVPETFGQVEGATQDAK